MTQIEIRPISLPGDIAHMVKSWWPIYADDPHWVPPLVFERKAFLNPKKNPYFKVADVQFFMAYRDGKPVGSISAQVDHELQKTEPGVGMFGFFEFVDDLEVSSALFASASGWLRERGMKVARGPFSFNTNHEFGLLVDGFDTDPMIANPHNRSYYAAHYEAMGLAKVMDWYAYWMDKGEVPPKIQKIATWFMKRNPDLRIRKMNLKDFGTEARLFREIYNDAWEHNWSHVYMTEDEFYFAAEGLKQVMDPDLCYFIYMGDELAGASITLPDYNQPVKKMNGSLFPFGWWHFLTGRKKIDALRVWVLGVKRKFQHLPLGAPLYLKTWEEGRSRNIRGAEASLILETNVRMRGALEKLTAEVYKTYRTYEMDLVEGGLGESESPVET
jgi:hypothetical protein